MLFAALAALAYVAAAVLLARSGSNGFRGNRGYLPLAALALLFHAEVHVEAWRGAQSMDLHFFAALSLATLVMAGITTAIGAMGRMPALGVFVYPLSALLVLAYELHGHAPSPAMDWRLLLHAWLALFAYATLAIAALVAFLLWLQERALRRRQFGEWMRALPPLTELETLLFRTILAGFLLLTAALLTGVLFVEDLMAQHLAHKTVFSVLSWLAFAVLLLGRRLRGWRGAIAVRWTLVAMALLVLAYFGSKFVLELVLGRG